MALIRKDRAGSDSFGHTWDADGAVVDLDDADQIAALMAIPDGGFSEVTPEADAPDSDDATDDGGDSGDDGEMSEIDPQDDDATDAPARRPAKKAAARKTTASKLPE